MYTAYMLYYLIRLFPMKIHIFVRSLYFDVWDIYNALDKGQQLWTYVLHCLYIYILAVYRKSMSRISSNRKAHHVAHNETVGILSKKPRKSISCELLVTQVVGLLCVVKSALGLHESFQMTLCMLFSEKTTFFLFIFLFIKSS